MPNYDWTLKGALKLVAKAKESGQESLVLDTELVRYQNECMIFDGLRASGFDVVHNAEHWSDRVVVRNLQK